MEDFFQMIGEVLSFIFLGLGFIFYITYQNQLTTFAYTASIILLVLAVVLGFGQSYARYHRTSGKTETSEETGRLLVDLSPIARLYYDLATWVCVAAILGVALLTDQGLNSKDIVQAGIALIGFTLGRKMLVRES